MSNDELIVRRHYGENELGEEFLLGDPLSHFKNWLLESKQNGDFEPDAFVLSTCSSSGVNARMVALRGIADDSLYIYTNYNSNKAKEIEENNDVALTFYFASIFRQVRMKAKAYKLDSNQNDRYFATRPQGSKIGAWVSRQSEPLGSRKELIETYKQYEHDLGDNIERPPFWGGYRLVPYEYEFMQGHKDRLHDRFKFQILNDGTIKRERLWP
ncbi:MAG: pyridoxamine 5'-phosphate oxidase [Acidimicrobiia bacterium]